MRWVGIDEAGYGPNLGPLVMTAVVAEGPGPTPPDVWADRAATVDRAGGDASRLWIDDSKRLHVPGKPPRRLEAACLAADAAIGPNPSTRLIDLLRRFHAGDLDATEWGRWLPSAAEPGLPRFGATADGAALAGAGWSLVDVRCAVVGPEAFNRGLARLGSKAAVHFETFASLLRGVWDGLGPGHAAEVRGDKHGGRHFYLGPLTSAFPEAWIDREEEGPASSRYRLREGGRGLSLQLLPKADALDGLVALASIISKYVRECWMEDFNAFWMCRVPGLRPSAGYPVDASRFRSAIEAEARALGLEPSIWWRER